MTRPGSSTCRPRGWFHLDGHPPGACRLVASCADPGVHRVSACARGCARRGLLTGASPFRAFLHPDRRTSPRGGPLPSRGSVAACDRHLRAFLVPCSRHVLQPFPAGPHACSLGLPYLERHARRPSSPFASPSRAPRGADAPHRCGRAPVTRTSRGSRGEAASAWSGRPPPSGLSRARPRGPRSRSSPSRGSSQTPRRLGPWGLGRSTTSYPHRRSADGSRRRELPAATASAPGGARALVGQTVRRPSHQPPSGCSPPQTLCSKLYDASG